MIFEEIDKGFLVLLDKIETITDLLNPFSKLNSDEGMIIGKSLEMIGEQAGLPIISQSGEEVQRLFEGGVTGLQKEYLVENQGPIMSLYTYVILIKDSIPLILKLIPLQNELIKSGKAKTRLEANKIISNDPEFKDFLDKMNQQFN